MATSRSAQIYEGLNHATEMPEPRKAPRWYLIGAGVVLLAVAGMAAKAYSSSGALFSASATRGGEVQDWEELPGMDKVIKKAQSLTLKHPLRNLNDLFYDSQPEEECVIDTVQAAAYLGQAVVFLYKAIDYNGLECPDNSPVGCAASVAGFITSITWIASYLSFAANACGQAVNSGAALLLVLAFTHACGTGDFTALMANFGEIATVGAAVKADCDFGKNAISIITNPDPVSPPWAQFVPGGAGPEAEKILAIKGHQEAKRNRDFDITQCVMDVTNSASYIVRVILQIRAAGSACPDPKACAVGIMNIISSFAWISQFTALAVSDCQVGADQKALCTADISDMVAAVTNGPAAGIASTSDCADL
ncbi:HERC1 [Symbiodinium natans]|uniref:HERC1 protein n=1 Tax=Symbiodinium natans TaxID=878477 RepID=A0A812PEF5_9DINO|nr:HERC1 [Symbiodinium natans]